MSTVNFTEFFKEEQDIWVRNIGNRQVSLEFLTSGGNSIGRCIPQVPDPINLTQDVPWEAIKNSHDFRRMLRRQPPLLVLMTSSEVEEWFSEKARKRELFTADPTTGERVPDTARALEMAEERVQKLTRHAQDHGIKLRSPHPHASVNNPGFAPPASAQAADARDQGTAGPSRGDTANLGDRPVQLRERVHPRVLNITNALKPATDGSPPSMEPADALDELEAMAAQLTSQDARYLQHNVPSIPVQRWAALLADERDKEQAPADTVLAGR